MFNTITIIIVLMKLPGAARPVGFHDKINCTQPFDNSFPIYNEFINIIAGEALDERSAVRRLKRGDLRGLEWLVMEYHTQAIHVAFLIIGDVQMAEDVVQDAFLNAYRYIDGFDEKRALRPWFMRSVSNLAVQTAQKETNKVSLETGSDDVDLMELLNSGDQPIEEQIESSEFKGKLWHTIQRLTPRQRAAVVQRYFLEMNEKEMAEKLGVAPGTVKWLLNAARKKLRALLSSERNRL